MTPTQITKDKAELLARKYGTDKYEHGYLKYYTEWLSGFEFKHKSMLEIGCFRAASLHMWNELFQGQVKIHTIDLFGEGLVDIDTLHKLGYCTHQGDQSNISFLYTIREMFDFIIDDGSHNSDHQIISFKHLFLNNLRSGGMYVIEDLHCCKDSFYWNGAIDRVEDSMLGIIQGCPTTPSKYFTQAEADLFFNPDFGLVKNYHLVNEKIALFIRR